MKVKELQRTGKTTKLAVSFILEALQKPMTWITIKDHHHTGDENLYELILGMSKAWDLDMQFTCRGRKTLMRSRYLGVIVEPYYKVRDATLEDLKDLK